MLDFLFACLIFFLLYGIPLASAVFFLVNFINYRSAKRCNRKKPGSIVEDWIDRARRRTVISGVVAAVLVIVCAGYSALFLYGIAHM